MKKAAKEMAERLTKDKGLRALVAEAMLHAIAAWEDGGFTLPYPCADSGTIEERANALFHRHINSL